MPAPPRSICILRLSAIGDVTHVLPLIATIQQEWPQCRITWIIGKIEYQLVKNLPDVEFIVFDKSQGWREYLALRRRLGQRRFDVLMMMQVALRANLLSLLIKADMRLGFDRARSRDLHHLFCNTQIQGPSRVHVLDGFFQFVERLGIRQRHMDWLLEPQPQSTDWARSQLGEKATVAINPCSSVRKNNWRNWPEPFYAEVIDYLIGDCGVQVVLTGGPSAEEKAYSERIIQQTAQQPLNLVGKTSLDQLLAILHQSQCLIAPDTGPAHMGTVAGIPVIGLFASSNPLRTGPYSSQEVVVNAYPQALQQYSAKTVAEARWGERVRDPQVMNLITPEMVLKQLQALGFKPA